jgi:cyanate permease
LGITGGIGGETNRVSNYALVSLGFSCATFIGPMSAGFSIDHLGHLPTFLLLSMFTWVPIMMLFFMPKVLKLNDKHQFMERKQNVFDMWRLPALRNTLIASGIIAMAWDLFQFYMPVYGYSMGLSASSIGIVLGFFALATLIIRIILPFLMRKVTETEILSYAIFVAALAFFQFPFFRNVYALATIAFLLGLGCGCGQPISMSLVYVLSPRGRVSEAAGLRTMVNNFIALIIPLFFGSIGTIFGYFPVFFSNSLLLLTGGILIHRNIKLKY